MCEISSYLMNINILDNETDTLSGGAVDTFVVIRYGIHVHRLQQATSDKNNTII